MPTSGSRLSHTENRPNEAAILRTLNAFAVDLITIPSAEDLFWYVAQNVVGRLKFLDCVIYEANPDRTELVQVAALGEKNPFGRNILNPLRIPFGQGITGQVAETARPLIVDDLLKDQNYIPDAQPARSEICVPLICHGTVVGVIDSEHPDIAAFGPAELEILTTVAAMTSAKLELLAEAERSNRRYRDMVESHAQLTRETNNRRALEAKLFEARKLESIGRLTGRFAHDFNNFLTVISGNLEFIRDDITDPDSIQCFHDAQLAASRGAKLIRDMLAFSQQARLERQISHLNTLVTAISARMRHVLIDAVDLTLDLADDLWPVNVDAKATENAVLHLIANAQDAMPNGGSVLVKTENITHDWTDEQARLTDLAPGRYACLSVEDHGAGIPADRLQQIFDPFYTTKVVGTGSGLGLSTIQGFMQQLGGGVTVQSTVDHGSTFRLYFPAANDGADMLALNS